MTTEDIKKTEVNKIDAGKTRKSGKSMTITKIPVFAHNHIKEYNLRLNHDRGKKHTIKEAYREYVVEKVKEDVKAKLS
jgi:hypothetical protein